MTYIEQLMFDALKKIMERAESARPELENAWHCIGEIQGIAEVTLLFIEPAKTDYEQTRKE